MTRDERRQTFWSIVRAVSEQQGELAAPVREAAVRGAALPAALAPLAAKIRAGAADVTDEDVAAVQAAGYNDDQVFELTVATALGESSRRLRAVLNALGRGGTDDAPRGGAR
jgi:alkylhydroperoxidase family enzyme